MGRWSSQFMLVIKYVLVNFGGWEVMGGWLGQAKLG